MSWWSLFRCWHLRKHTDRAHQGGINRGTVVVVVSWAAFQETYPPGPSGNIPTGPIRDGIHRFGPIAVSWLDSQEAYRLDPVARDGEEDVLSKVS